MIAATRLLYLFFEGAFASYLGDVPLDDVVGEALWRGRSMPQAREDATVRAHHGKRIIKPGNTINIVINHSFFGVWRRFLA